MRKTPSSQPEQSRALMLNPTDSSPSSSNMAIQPSSVTGPPLQQPHPPPVVSFQMTSPLADVFSSTWLAIGALSESLGDHEKAIASYDLAVRHAPNNVDAILKLANAYRSRDVFFKAAELYEQALGFNAENGETWGALGHCYLMLDDLQRAYAAYQRALFYLEDPNSPKLWHGIGILYDRYGSLEYAEEAFVRVLELDQHFDKSNEIYFRLGIIYKHQGKLTLALECFQYILHNPPQPLTQPDVWFQIGLVLELQKNWVGARDAYFNVLAVNPQHAKVLQQLGCLYSQAEPETALGLPKNGNATSHPQAFQQDLDMATKYLLQSLEIDQLDAHSWYYLGRVHMIRSDFNAAYEAFQQAVNRDSRNPTFWCSIGVLYYQISQYRDALDAYTRAIRLNPYILEVWYDLGTLYETCNNQISDALDAYLQAERLDPGNPHITARLKQLREYQQDGNTHPPQPPPSSQQPRLPQGMVLESLQPPQPSQQQHPPQQQQPQQQPQPPSLQPQQPHNIQGPPSHLHPHATYMPPHLKQGPMETPHQLHLPGTGLVPSQQQQQQQQQQEQGLAPPQQQQAHSPHPLQMHLGQQAPGQQPGQHVQHLMNRMQSPGPLPQGLNPINAGMPPNLRGFNPQVSQIPQGPHQPHVLAQMGSGLVLSHGHGHGLGPVPVPVPVPVAVRGRAVTPVATLGSNQPHSPMPLTHDVPKQGPTPVQTPASASTSAPPVYVSSPGHVLAAPAHVPVQAPVSAPVPAAAPVPAPIPAPAQSSAPLDAHIVTPAPVNVSTEAPLPESKTPQSSQSDVPVADQSKATEVSSHQQQPLSVLSLKHDMDDKTVPSPVKRPASHPNASSLKSLMNAAATEPAESQHLGTVSSIDRSQSAAPTSTSQANHDQSNMSEATSNGSAHVALPLNTSASPVAAGASCTEEKNSAASQSGAGAAAAAAEPEVPVIANGTESQDGVTRSEAYVERGTAANAAVDSNSAGETNAIAEHASVAAPVASTEPVEPPMRQVDEDEDYDDDE